MIAGFIKSMGYALNGIVFGIKNERNVRIDIVAMIYVHIFSVFYDFTLTQRVIIVLVCFNILAFELMNTAVEQAVDNPDKEHYMTAGHAKDAAAGGVLLAAIGAAVAGIMMFWNVAVFKEIFEYFTTSLSRLMLLCASIIFSYLFITYDKLKKR